ncbi:MAG: amino acid ABC transporter substrate-binding protein [Candidatus Lokiarchaeota archaeon]|nr:amino acid ABC transporter substrate-binding protein [Candidatus Lokiarchaeota archaeon]
MKREFAVLGIVIALGLGLLGGWFIPSPLTTPEQASLVSVIQTRGTLNVGTSADWPPFENFTYPFTGAIEGFDVDVSQLVADDLGVTLNMVHMDFGNLISACAVGTIDMIAAAMNYNEERAASLAPSSTYISVSQVVIVKETSLLTTISHLGALGGLTVGCQTGTVMQDELIDLGNVTVSAYPSAVVLMTNLINDNIDAAYVDEPVFTSYNRTEGLRIIFTTGSEPISLWTRYGEPEFLYFIDNAILDAYKDETIYDLFDTWFG